MSKKHFELITATNRAEFAEKVNKRLQEGWELLGNAGIASEPGVPWYLMQAMVSGSDDQGGTIITPTSDSEPEWYYVVVSAGQSNSMAYGEGLPLPESYDKPDSRIRQLARRSTVTPSGKACAYNDIILADHCLHDVQDMSQYNHPKADLNKGQYGCVSQGLHIAKRLLPFIPANAGILLVPCSRGGSGFTTGDAGQFSEIGGATEKSCRWGTNTPLYKDLISRTKAALAKNPKNVLLAVCWTQGEADLEKEQNAAQHKDLFTAMVKQFRADLADVAKQCNQGNPESVPWICGDTTYHWKKTYEAQYATVYGGYKNSTEKNIVFVPFVTDEYGKNTPTNEPTEDPDIAEAGYYGAASRSSGNWVSHLRGTHFSSWARRGIIADRMASAILLNVGRTLPFIAGTEPERVAKPSQDAPGGISKPSSPEAEQPAVRPGPVTLMSLLASSPELESQGWTLSEGKNGANTPKQLKDMLIGDEEATGKKALKLTKQEGNTWYLEHKAGNGADLLKNGGTVSCRFKIEGELKKDQYAMAMYWKTSALPQDVKLLGADPNNLLLSFFLQTESANLNLMYHKTPNEQLGTFGQFNNNWHTIAFRFAGNNSTQVTPVLDGVDGKPFMLSTSKADVTNDTLRVTDITYRPTYTVLIDSLSVVVNQPPA
ncbi:sialate O-acetylesterase [Escherichia coli]|nr:sialate O-acetylesterase [Escherichia coli]EHZ4158417.1 DUF1737 domain-containing protein [Escherichia coli]